MFFEQQLKWSFLLFFGVVLQSIAQPNEIEASQLKVQPNKCVALNQGRECFMQVIINWRQQRKGHYCLFLIKEDEQANLIKCWTNAQQGQYEFEFASTTNIQFLLADSNGQQNFASSLVEVSWLYKSNSRKRRWRLF